ncbi:MAG: ABC transporter permease [Sporolactobacillus sp.]|jgi:ABC-2 type transport system permease protein|nr:ABC transporter permease [Sporolactobacillus sp.]
MWNRWKDTFVLSHRVMKHNYRSPDTLITVVGMPVMMLLLFVYVFGGAIEAKGQSYVNFVVPGIILFAMASGSAYTALRINVDKTSGIFDRFRSMPIARSAILSGHVFASVFFMAIATVIVVLISLLCGFRPSAGPLQWLGAIGLLTLFAFAMTWLSVPFGLTAGNAEGAGAFSYLLLMLLFISSAFVPTDSMPTAVRLFAEHQPMTPIIQAVRDLLLDRPVGNDGWWAADWCVAIILAAYLAALRAVRTAR